MPYTKENPPKRKPLSFKGTKSRTKQQFAKDADINNIMRKYVNTGLVPQKSGGRYGDFSSGADYQEALAKIAEAEDNFGHLPADIRNRFKNDPFELIQFVSDDSNREEALELGLIFEDPPAPPVAIEEPKNPLVADGGE